MQRILALLYGFAAYLTFLGTFLYAIGFVSGLVVPKTIDSGSATSLTAALIIDVVLMSIFALQHSIMARPAFKRWWTQFVPKSIERSTYVLAASLALALLLWQWRPIPAVVWQVSNPTAAMTLMVLEAVGWLIVLSSTFLINHFELFGLHQVANNLAGKPMPAPRFQHAAALQICAPSDLSRLHHRFLGGADHDRRASVVRRGDHGLHLRRHRARGT